MAHTKSTKVGIAGRCAVVVATVALSLSVLVAAPARHRGNAKHVVLVVWDGMRPDFVSEQNSPTLWKLAREGVTFRNHHCAYPSATNVNGAVMATGVLPGHSGLIANLEFRPEIDALRSFDTADAASIRRGDELSGRRYLKAPTVPELLREAGKRSAIAATKTVATLFDRSPRAAPTGCPTLAMGAAEPEPMRTTLRDSLGEYPPKQTPNSAQDDWTTSALTDTFWKDGVPAFSLLWLSDPDFAQHDIAAGSPEALAGIKNSDAQLAKVLATLEAKGVREETDVLVVSDHGFSTVDRAIDVPALFNDAGFNAVMKLEGDPEPGTILVIGNGGTVLFYVTDHDSAVARRLVEWLQQSDFAGVIFARKKTEGTFALAEAGLEQAGGPEVVMAFSWREGANEFGAPGLITADWNRAPGKGTHATLSRFDLHNTLIAAGPDFRRDYEDELPTGNIDLAPTILHLLGVAAPAKLDGRILSEALRSSTGNLPEAKTTALNASRRFPSTKWQQHLRVSTVKGVRYIDEGNGASTADSPEQ